MIPVVSGPLTVPCPCALECLATGVSGDINRLPVNTMTDDQTAASVVVGEVEIYNLIVRQDEMTFEEMKTARQLIKAT